MLPNNCETCENSTNTPNFSWGSFSFSLRGSLAAPFQLRSRAAHRAAIGGAEDERQEAERGSAWALVG